MCRPPSAPELAEAVGRERLRDRERQLRARPQPDVRRDRLDHAQVRAVLVVPRAQPGLSGPAEEDAFRRLVPSPERSAEIAQLVLTSLLPALVEDDVGEFGGALTRVQELVGDAFAEVQGGRFHPRAGALVEALLREGAAGAGQSSWGPAVYGIAGSEASGRALADRMAGIVGDEGSVGLVTFDNRGALVERQ